MRSPSLFRLPSTRLATGAVAIALLAAGCGSDASSVQSGPGDTAASTTTVSGTASTIPGGQTDAAATERLASTQWRFIHSVVGGDAVVPVEPGVVALIDFVDQTVVGNAGCNDFGGTLDVASDGESLTISDLAIQELACLDRADWPGIFDLARSWDVTFVGANLDLTAVDGSGAGYRLIPAGDPDAGIDDKELNPLADSIIAEYLGLREGEAIAKAEAEGRPVRVVERDGESFPVTLDYNADRINLVVNDDLVTSAHFG